MKTAATPVLNSIETTKVRLGCGRTKVLDLVKARDLDAVKLGRRTLIKEASIQQLAGRLPRVR
ncbi:helix-turn-helix domain-containing protein [Methylobacterium sp. WL103]|nr:helix-turn-helix domain-containing protein [Methylobacterium sp. WL103]